MAKAKRKTTGKVDRTKSGNSYISRHKLEKAQTRHMINIKHRGGKITENYYDKKTGKYIIHFHF